MLQKDLLLPYRTIEDNVALPLLLKGMKKKEARLQVSPVFSQFGLDGTQKKYPAQLSGGMRQRAALLRTYGMAASVFLQYHGVADFLSDTYADNLSEVRLNSKTISMVNYYQAQAASSYLCENIAPIPGTAFYSENLKNVYETVKSGSPVLLTYYKDDYLVTMGHAVTLTGAFEDSYGNKFVVGYDSNYYYTWGECHYFRITPDYSAFYSCYNSPKNTEEFQEWHNVPVTGFNWTADYEQFTSFDINGEGDPMVWYRVFFAHIIYFISTLFSTVF